MLLHQSSSRGMLDALLLIMGARYRRSLLLESYRAHRGMTLKFVLVRGLHFARHHRKGQSVSHLLHRAHRFEHLLNHVNRSIQPVCLVHKDLYQKLKSNQRLIFLYFFQRKVVSSGYRFLLHLR